MQKLRLLFLLVVVVAFGVTCVAQSQDGTGGLDDQVQNKFADKDQDQPKAKADKKQGPKVKSNEGHRKHWWSLPHLRHKKHDNDYAARQQQAKSDNKTASAKSVNNAPAPKRTASTASIANPSHKTAAMQRSETHRNAATKTAHKTVAGKSQTTTAVAGRKAPRKARGKTVAATNHARKPVLHNCTSAEMKNGGCQAVQKHTTKTATRAS